MTKDLSVDLRAIRMMSGITIWVEAEKAEKIRAMLSDRPQSEWPGMLTVGDEIIHTRSIEGVYTAAVMESDQRRRNGQWQCKFAKWHDKGERCDCRAEAARDARYKKTAEMTREPEWHKCMDPKLSRHCTGCTDGRSEGAHQGCKKEHGHVGCDIVKGAGWPMSKDGKLLKINKA